MNITNWFVIIKKTGLRAGQTRPTTQTGVPPKAHPAYNIKFCRCTLIEKPRFLLAFAINICQGKV